MSQSEHGLRARILEHRKLIAGRGLLDPQTANAAWVEPESDGRGGQVNVLTLLLTVSECPWKCAMCDLWKHTLPRPTHPGDVPRQLERALEGLSSDVRWIKLYNSGNFFDAKSIPPADHRRIAQLCKSFDRVIVENHPRLCSARVRAFADQLAMPLEIALGVESLQPGMLRRLNKGMNRDDIDRAIFSLRRWGIDVRAFLLLRPPWTNDYEAVLWTLLSLKHLFRLGVRHASIIPVRAGNGWLDHLHSTGEFHPPSIPAVEQVLDRALTMAPRGVVTIDLWNWPDPVTASSNMMESTMACSQCVSERGQRLAKMNLTQLPQSAVICEKCDAKSQV